MKENRGVPSPLPPAHLSEEELAARITRALRSREAARPEAAFVAARLRAEAARRGAAPSGLRRGGKIVVTGVVTSALAVAGAGAAAAAAPYSQVARVVESAAQAIGLDWSPMPDGYTRAQYDAFWDAGYTIDDVHALQNLWHTDTIGTKARAGQMLLDGQKVPVEPGSTPVGEPEPVDPAPTLDPQLEAELQAFWAAGYTSADVAALVSLWNTDELAAKARAGELLLDGEKPPILPSGAAVGDDVTDAELAALWNAGYTFDDVEALAALWDLTIGETKARAGEMALNGQPLPIPPGAQP